MSIVESNVGKIRNTIAQSALRCGRDPARVKLMAVTKTVDDESIMEAIEAGVDLIGENYVQEAQRKIEKMGKKGLEWHMIGSLQSNKAKHAVRLFDMIHSVSSMNVAAELDRRAGLINRVTKILVEVNLAGESSKSGLAADEVIAFLRSICSLPRISVRGLMTMPPWTEEPENSRPYFRRLREISDRIRAEAITGIYMEELSMGDEPGFHRGHRGRRNDRPNRHGDLRKKAKPGLKIRNGARDCSEDNKGFAFQPAPPALMRCRSARYCVSANPACPSRLSPACF